MNRFPDPRPPVSGPPPNEVGGSSGATYGTVNRAKWAAGDNEEKQIISTDRSAMLWRISVFGPVTVRIDYGTVMRQPLTLLASPVVMTIPGSASVYVTPSDPEHAAIACKATLTAASAGARAHARKIIDAGAGAVLFEESAVNFVALTASTLTISGIAVVVPALSAVPLVAGSRLDTGSGYQEFEA